MTILLFVVLKVVVLKEKGQADAETLDGFFVFGTLGLTFPLELRKRISE